MTPADSAAIWPIIKAHAEGQAIQVRACNGDWEDAPDPVFNFGRHFYRIAPAKVRVKGWLNAYNVGCGTLYETKAIADQCATPGRIACVEIDVEGEWLG